MDYDIIPVSLGTRDCVMPISTIMFLEEKKKRRKKKYHICRCV